MTISSLLISVSYYEKKNNKNKKKKTEQSKKNHKDNATCANNLFALSLSLARTNFFPIVSKMLYNFKDQNLLVD